MTTYSDSVTNVCLYRTYREEEGLDLSWIQKRILEPERTEAMLAGEALHKALEGSGETETNFLEANGYRFEFVADCDIAIPQFAEAPVSREYGDLTVRGRVDSLIGKVVSDYKSTESFDGERFMDSYQWRFYLDMTGADVFRYLVFQMYEAEPKVYVISQFHQLKQARYPGLHRDCRALACDYLEFMKRYIVPLREAGKTILERQLQESLDRVNNP